MTAAGLATSSTSPLHVLGMETRLETDTLNSTTCLLSVVSGDSPSVGPVESPGSDEPEYEPEYETEYDPGDEPEAQVARPCGADCSAWTAGARRRRLALLASLSCLLLLLLLSQLTQQQPQLLQLATAHSHPISTPNTTTSTLNVTASTSTCRPVTERSSQAPAVYAPVTCPTDLVISTHSQGGRLGNTMAEYASIFALGLRYNITAVMTRSLLRLMRRAFLDLSLPVIFEYCLLDDRRATVEEFEQVPDQEKRASSWEIVWYAHRISLFWQYRHLLRSEFTLRPELAAGAQRQLRDVAGNRTDLTFIGLHVRRTDYARHLWTVFQGYMLNESFYLGAMTLCRTRYRHPVFVVSSDDLQWCRQHLAGPDVHVIGDSRAVSPGVERDLALMAACNHSIFDYGTFGFFGAFLAGGDLILADGYAKKEHEIVSELRIGGINATFLNPEGNVLPHCLLCTTTGRPTASTKRH